VTAVQLTKVTQLSEWQREYNTFSKEQIGFVQHPKNEANV
jgi:formate dehydrogenase major subunit